MEPCSQEGRISRIEAAVEAIGGQVATLITSVNELKTKLEPILEKVEEHDRALYGNNGTVGIVAKVVNALEVLDNLDYALRGKSDRPGLIAVINGLDKKISEREDTGKWIARLVIGWFITTVLGLVIFAVR